MAKRSCFVIMPFSKSAEAHTEEYWNDFYDIIEEIMVELDFVCSRSEAGPYDITEQVIKKVTTSDLLLSVLTDYNPNVWYELGMRHSFKEGTIMLIQNGQNIPFDVSHFGVIKYEDGIKIKKKLKQSISDYVCKLAAGYCDSPVIKVVSSSDKDKGQLMELVMQLAEEMTKLNRGERLSPNSIGIASDGQSEYNRILWIDDYPSNNEMVIQLFEKVGIKIDLAINTEGGIKLLNEKKYDLIITDMGRGREADAGNTFIQKTKKLKKAMIPPIIVYASQSAIEKHGQRSIELGASATLSGVAILIGFVADVFKVNFSKYLSNRNFPLEDYDLRLK